MVEISQKTGFIKSPKGSTTMAVEASTNNGYGLYAHGGSNLFGSDAYVYCVSNFKFHHVCDEMHI